MQNGAGDFSARVIDPSQAVGACHALAQGVNQSRGLRGSAPFFHEFGSSLFGVKSFGISNSINPETSLQP